MTIAARTLGEIAGEAADAILDGPRTDARAFLSRTISEALEMEVQREWDSDAFSAFAEGVVNRVSALIQLSEEDALAIAEGLELDPDDIDLRYLPR